MKAYTRNQLDAIGLAFYRRGLEDGRLPRDRQTGLAPPTLEELGIIHPLTSSDNSENMKKRNSWLDGALPAR